jgi:nondiscriminating glutamyl-tRNA synthetase
MEEAFEEFDPARLSRSPSMFDNDHLNWMNSTYIKNLEESRYLELVKPFLLKNEKLVNADEEKLTLISKIYKGELVYLAQINELVDLVLVKNNEFDKESIFSIEAKDLLAKFANLLENSETKTFDKDSFKLVINELISLTGVKGKNLYMPIRLALTGHEHGVELFNIINILGKEEAIRRLKEEA